MTRTKTLLTAFATLAFVLTACDAEELETEQDDSFRAKHVKQTDEDDLIGWTEYVFAQPQTAGRSATRRVSCARRGKAATPGTSSARSAALSSASAPSRPASSSCSR